MIRAERAPRVIAALIAAIGLVLTCLVSWTLAHVDANSERRLLKVQTQQAASVLSTAVMLVEQPLATALSVQEVAGPDDRAAFAKFIESSVGPQRVFASVSLWQRRGSALTRISTAGVAPTLAPEGAEARAFLRDAFDTTGTTLRVFKEGGQDLLVWGKADPRTGYAVYAERVLTDDRRSSLAADSAYAGLHYAMYVGHGTDLKTLLSTDVDPDSLPLGGDTARETIPFGGTDVTLVTKARVHLGSTLSRWLPLGVLVLGLVLTALAALSGLRLARGQRSAEQREATITGLYERVDLLYGQQRDLFERLQRALLPQGDLGVADLDVAARYVSGSQGTEIGGDWYSLLALDDARFAFVVGDVSGRGVDTVAVMAKARFTLRAYLLDGDEPAVALEKCSRQFDIAEDGHLTTVVAGVGDTRTGEVRIANAGHPPPLLLNGAAEAVVVPPGRPLGAGASHYDQTTIHLDPGATLFCFTDGLVERRGESIDAGLDRLARTLSGAQDLSLDDLVAHTVDSLRADQATDDIAALALRRTEAR